MWFLVVRRRVVVNLRSGNAVEGVLVRKSGKLLFVKDAVLHTVGSEPTKAEGEIVVERSNVDFIQAL